MVGFGSLGALGRGGFGASYPSRGGVTPNSQQVGYVPDQQTWEADWQRRWDETLRGPASADPGPGPRPDAPTSTGISSSWGAGGSPMDWAQANRHLYSQDAPIPTMGWSFQTGVNPNYHPDAPTAVWGPQFERNGYQEAPSATPYVPDFTALNAEREAMMPQFENRDHQQQAYDWMRGGNAMNGILSEAYAQPGFNHISSAGGAEGNSGINSGTGLYDPLTGSGAIGQARPRRWGQ